jgi:hypothetical protein
MVSAENKSLIAIDAPVFSVSFSDSQKGPLNAASD